MMNHVYFKLKNFRISGTLKYTKTVGRMLFNHNFFSKNSSSLSMFSCYYNDPHLKIFIDSDHAHIITGNLKIINNLQLNKLIKYIVPNLNFLPISLSIQ